MLSYVAVLMRGMLFKNQWLQPKVAGATRRPYV